MFPKKTVFILSLVVLAGCAKSPTHATDYNLCYKLATIQGFNVNRGAREAEVRNRNLDCRVYAGRIDEEQRAVDLAEAGATRINNTTTVQQPIQPKNDTLVCTTYGTQTYCN